MHAVLLFAVVSTVLDGSTVGISLRICTNCMTSSRQFCVTDKASRLQQHIKSHKNRFLLCFVDRASLYNLVNKTNLVHSSFLVYLSISTCFGRLCAHHQEKQLCFATLGTCYSVWMTVWYGGCTLHTVIHTE